ncbi:MAG: hypothetical protein ACI4KF_11245 [Huintestinicola sp.]
MKKKFDLSTLLSMIHLVFVLSIVCFSVTFLSLGILAMPSFTAAFILGKEVLYKQYDVYDSVVKRFFSEMKRAIKMMRYFPLQLLIILQTGGMYAVGKVGMSYLMVPMLAFTAFLLTLLIYIITYHVFYREFPHIPEVLIAMFYRIQYLLIIFVLMLLAAMFFGTIMMIVLFFAGALILFLLEATAFLGIMAFKVLRNDITEEENQLLGEDLKKLISR